ncbi:MAG: RHS repeat-associated core domain-containing protein [Candidatus Aenigmatarchaeota archaeon]
MKLTWNMYYRYTNINGNVLYKYDHNDLKVEKTKAGLKTTYYYDGSLLLAEKDESGKIQKVYINDGEGIIGMVRYIYDSSNTFSHYQRMYYLYDSLGSVSAVADENGLPLQEYYYTPYGSTSNVEYDAINSLRFIGRYGGYKDDDTSFTYFWHRWYDERDGRWVSRDPVGVRGLLNLFRYTGNCPINYIDSNGLCPDGPEWQPLPLPTIPIQPSRTPPYIPAEPPALYPLLPYPTAKFCELKPYILTETRSDCPGLGEYALFCVVTCKWSNGKITRVIVAFWEIVDEVEACNKKGKPKP